MENRSERAEIDLVRWDRPAVSDNEEYRARGIRADKDSVGRRGRADVKSAKQRRRRRQQRLRAIRTAALLLVALAAFGGVGRLGIWAGKGLVGLFNQGPQGTSAVGYVDEDKANLDLPQVYEGEAIRSELKRLAESDKAYAKICDNYDAYPEKLLAALCSNEELLPFVEGYLTSDGQAHGALTDKELAEDVPLFFQWDARWGYAPYGESDIALSGCAPTCLSMVAVALTGRVDITPNAVADYASDAGYYLPGTGTSWSLMTEGCRHFDLESRELGLDENVIKKQLKAGNPIICSMRPGDFTTSGHFIVLAGVQDGKFIVHDPNSKKRSLVLWSYDTISSQIKNLWAFSKI